MTRYSTLQVYAKYTVAMNGKVLDCVQGVACFIINRRQGRLFARKVAYFAYPKFL